MHPGVFGRLDLLAEAFEAGFLGVEICAGDLEGQMVNAPKLLILGLSQKASDSAKDFFNTLHGALARG